MKPKDIRKLSDDGVQSGLDDAKENYFKLRFQFTTGQLTDHTRLSIARRDIARYATILRERELVADVEGSES